MGYKQIQTPTLIGKAAEQFELFDHFLYFIDADLWTEAEVGTGTVGHEGAGRSRMALFCTAANDAAVLATTNELFKFTANKSMLAWGLINGSDVNTDDGIVFFGWADAMAGTTLADTTGAVTATDACGLYKLPGTTVWAFHTEINGAVTATTSTTSALTGSAQELKIEVTPRSATVFECRPFVDGFHLEDANGNKIMHTVTLGTATDMDFGMLTKSTHANDFTVYVDALYASQLI